MIESDALRGSFFFLKKVTSLIHRFTLYTLYTPIYFLSLHYIMRTVLLLFPTASALPTSVLDVSIQYCRISNNFSDKGAVALQYPQSSTFNATIKDFTQTSTAKIDFSNITGPISLSAALTNAMIGLPELSNQASLTFNRARIILVIQAEGICGNGLSYVAYPDTEPMDIHNLVFQVFERARASTHIDRALDHCHVEMICLHNSHHPLPNDISFREITNTLSFSMWHIPNDQVEISIAMLNLVCLHNDLNAITITGIPMKRKSEHAKVSAELSMLYSRIPHSTTSIGNHSNILKRLHDPTILQERNRHVQYLKGKSAEALSLNYSCIHSIVPIEDKDAHETTRVFTRSLKSTKACLVAGQAQDGIENNLFALVHQAGDIYHLRCIDESVSQGNQVKPLAIVKEEPMIIVKQEDQSAILDSKPQIDREQLWKSCFVDSLVGFTGDYGISSTSGLIATLLERLKASIVDGNTNQNPLPLIIQELFLATKEGHSQLFSKSMKTDDVKSMALKLITTLELIAQRFRYLSPEHEQMAVFIDTQISEFRASYHSPTPQAFSNPKHLSLSRPSFTNPNTISSSGTDVAWRQIDQFRSLTLREQQDFLEQGHEQRARPFSWQIGGLQPPRGSSINPNFDNHIDKKPKFPDMSVAKPYLQYPTPTMRAAEEEQQNQEALLGDKESALWFYWMGGKMRQRVKEFQKEFDGRNPLKHTDI